MKKSSVAVPLILLGSIALLSGCGAGEPEQQIRQNQYGSQADCQKDWGNDGRDCKPNPSGSHAGYIGPSYLWNHGGGYPMAVNPDGSTRALPNSYLSKPGSVTTARSATTTSVSRGGFGSTGHGFSSAGG